jgi:hypothetical protein
MLNFKDWFTNEAIRIRIGVDKSSEDFIRRFISSVQAQSNPIDRNYYYMDGDALVKFQISPGYLKRGSVAVGELHIVPNKTGAGRRFMETLTRLADESNVFLELNAVPLKTNERIPLNKLKNLYKSFGFLQMPGESQNTMFRKPKVEI